MYIYGSFKSQQGETVTVYIVTNGDRTQTLEIGTKAADVYFSDDPVEITSEVNDTFDCLLRQSATVRLLCGNLISDFFSTSCRDAVVNIYKGSRCVYAGFIEPQTLSQPYNERWDELSLNCIDALSALQYSKYKDVGSLGVTYATVKAGAEQRTFYDIATEILCGVTDGLDLSGGQAIKFWYDGSKSVDAETANRYQIFRQISISDLLFLTGDESDVWQQDEVLEEMLKYLNLHIVQSGFDFYIFSWETVKAAAGQIVWHDIQQGAIMQTAQATVSIALDNVADCDTTITIGDVYNQLLLTDNVTEVDNVVENPLDSDSLIPAFPNYQRYMTEYIAEGEGKTALGAFGGMVTGAGSDWSDAKQVDWYMWVKKHPKWKFYQTDEDGVRQDVYSSYCTDGTNQQAVLSRCLNKGVGAAIVSFGSIEKQNGGSDNSPAAAPDMKDTLVIGLSTDYHGDWNTKSDDYGTSSYLTDGSKILAACPVAEYTDSDSGGTFSPSDDDTTNYIQISGKMALNPIMDFTKGFSFLEICTDWSSSSPFWHDTVPSRNNGDGRYYAQRFWKAEHWSDEVSDDDDCNVSQWGRGVYPFTGSGPQNYEYNYNAAKEAKDTISKVGVLQCMLVIGDKCVVETLPDNGGSGNGEPSDFSWKTFKERSACSSDDEYYQQSFSIGFDPKLKDKIVGTEFDIQKNAAYTVGVDVEGTLIPIKKSDKVSGKVRFMILGPVNSDWNHVTYRHHSFWRSSKYYTSNVPLLAHCSSIMVRDLEIKAVSDNGKVGSGSSDKDIVYMSDTKETFVNKKDDLEFRITTALTTAERVALGVQESVKLSAPRDETSGDALLGIYDWNGSVTAKPEQIYVDSYYTEYHKPRIIMEQKLTDTDDVVGLFNHYRHEALNKEFYVQGIGRNLIEGRADLTLKEIGV